MRDRCATNLLFVTHTFHTVNEFKPLGEASCSAQVRRQSSNPYLLVRRGVGPLAQQVRLSPHSRSAIRDGGEGSHPLSSTMKRLLSHSEKVRPYHPPPQQDQKEREPMADVTSCGKTSAYPPGHPGA